MVNEIELQRLVYNTLLMQIQFGTYRYGQNLPTMEDASGHFLVSIDTVRSAYLRLKQEGYISLSKNVGAVVKVDYNEQEIQQSVQAFFMPRKNALIDLGKSLRPMLGNIQWICLKNAGPGIPGNLKNLAARPPQPPYATLQFFVLEYGVLQNDLFTRLYWKLFIFLCAPFFSLPKSIGAGSLIVSQVQSMANLCDAGDWERLRAVNDQFHDQLASILRRFLEDELPGEVPVPEIDFTWSSYKKTSQLIYSLAAGLMQQIASGRYPAGSLLPSMAALSKEKNVSFKTTRRAIALLNDIGAAESVQRLGTRVLPPWEMAKHCDITRPSVQGRFQDFLQAMQVLTLSCRAVIEITIKEAGAASLAQWKEALLLLKRTRRCEQTGFISLRSVSLYAPYLALRTIYSELLNQLIWGHFLLYLHESQEALSACYRPSLDELLASLDRFDAAAYSVKLEELLRAQTESAVRHLKEMGLQDIPPLILS